MIYNYHNTELIISLVCQRERTYISHNDRDPSVDRPDLEHDKQRKRSDRDREDRRDHGRDDKELEKDSRELDNVPRMRKIPRRADDQSMEQLLQGGEGSENIGMYFNSASFYDDKNVLKSE